MDNNNTYNNTYNNKTYINQATIPRFMEKSGESVCSHVCLLELPPPLKYSLKRKKGSRERRRTRNFYFF